MHRSSLTRASKASLAALAVAGLTFGGATVAMGDVTDSQAPDEVVELVEDKRADADDAEESDDTADDAEDAEDAEDSGEAEDAEMPEEGEDAEDGSEVAAERHAELSGGTATPADGEEFGQAVAENARDNGTEQSGEGQATAEENKAAADERAPEEGDDADEAEAEDTEGAEGAEEGDDAEADEAGPREELPERP